MIFRNFPFVWKLVLYHAQETDGRLRICIQEIVSIADGSYYTNSI